MLMRLLDRCWQARSRSGFARLGLVFGLLAVAAFAGPSAFAQQRPKFGLDDVVAKAKALADAAYVAPVSNLPDVAMARTVRAASSSEASEMSSE